MLPYIKHHLTDLSPYAPLFYYSDSVQEFDALPAYHIHLNSESHTLLTAVIPIESLPLFYLYNRHYPNPIPPAKYRFEELTSPFSADEINQVVTEAFSTFNANVRKTLSILSDPELFPST